MRIVDGPGGLAFAEIRSETASARVCLHGAQVLEWQPRHAREPVLWLSNNVRYVPGKSMRGGIPVCWPWFGPHARDAALPSHGFARNLPWELRDSQSRPDGTTILVLRLTQSPNARVSGADGKPRTIEQLWPQAFALELRVVVGASLYVELHTKNESASDAWIGEALHTYFRVGDVSSVQVRGLEGRTYADKVEGGKHHTQSGAVRCNGEVDRVYFDKGPECVIEDPLLARRIRVRKAGSAATVVWSPGTEKARALKDLGIAADGREGWREMICVETANALEACVRVAPGADHRMSLEIAVENHESTPQEHTGR
jgi:D-hexose-6-phosphate mutarotase